MIQVLNVAEKNDAAKTISELLSNGQCRSRDGHSKFSKIYEFHHFLFERNVKMVVTSVSGHLKSVDFTPVHKNPGWQTFNPLTMLDAPIWKLCKEEVQKNIIKTLEEEAPKCQYLIIWTDGDREGENIAYQISEVCSAANPTIQIFRAKFSEITLQSIQRALANLGPINLNVSEAVNVRQELDLRIGSAFTRFQTLRLQQVFPQTLGGKRIISYGSCQFPTLGFIVERYLSIKRFVQEPFWKLKVILEAASSIKVEFAWKRNHLFDKETVEIILEKCLENPEAKVISVHSENVTKVRPVPLDTVELEKLAFRKLGINAKETMAIAEKLYCQGYISYPRTETNIFPTEMDLGSLVNIQSKDPSWGAFAQRLMGEEATIIPMQGKKSDMAHPPIHPLKCAGNELGEFSKQRKIYELVVRHFLACVSQDAQGLETVTEIEMNEEFFIASSLHITAPNYLEVYPYDEWNEKALPEFAQGSSFNPISILMEEGLTCHLPELSEADLITLMEMHGIGTDATHADLIEAIKSRNYANDDDGSRFLPTTLGIGLVQGYDAIGVPLSRPDLRAQLEKELKKICDGTRNPQDVLNEQITQYRQLLIQVMTQGEKIDVELEKYLNEKRQSAQVIFPCTNKVYSKCLKCHQSDLLLRRSKKNNNKSLFFSCTSFPHCKGSIWLSDKILNVEIRSRKCLKCAAHPPLLRFTFVKRAYAPYYEDVHNGCIGGCDQDLNKLLSIRFAF